MLNDNRLDPFEDEWQKLQPIVCKVLNQEDISDNDWRESTLTVIRICYWDMFENGAKKLKKQLRIEFSNLLKKIHKIIDDTRADLRLKSYIEEWEKYFATSYSMSKLFFHMHKFNEVHEQMKIEWHRNIFDKLYINLIDSAITLILKERNGETVDSHLVFKLKESCKNLMTMCPGLVFTFHEHFEVRYYNLLYRAYASEYLQFNAVYNYLRFKSVDQFLQSNGIDNYLKLNGEDVYAMYVCYSCMQYATSKFEEEAAKGKKYLEMHLDPIQLFIKTHDKILILSFKENIIDGYLQMIKCNEKLRLMLGQFDRFTDGIEHISKIFEKYIIDVGLAMTITQDPESYVEQLDKFYNNFNQLVKQAFNANHHFITSLNKAFTVVINNTTVFKLQLPTKFKSPPESRCPQLLALYCDSLLKKSSSDKISKKLRTVTHLIKYITNKDVFINFYKSHLSRRLILETSADSEMEENMVNWLQNVGMPADDLAKMLQDSKLSADFNNEFKEKQHAEGKLMVDTISVKVLNASAWASRNDNASVSLPIELESYILQVEQFYKSKHSEQKLQFHHRMSKGIITFVNEAGKFELEVTTFQMAVLFAWNDRPKHRISFENLKSDTQLSDTNLRKTLWSFIAFSKIKQPLLLCHPEVKSANDFDNSTELWINQEFTDMKKGKLKRSKNKNNIREDNKRSKMISKLSAKNNIREDNETIQIRELRIQEAILKTFKIKKTVTFSQLKSEVIEILKNMFLPTKKMIKEQIEFLLLNDYINRDPTSINSFIYI